MVQILPPKTSIGNEIGAGFQRGIERGQSLYAQMLPYLMNQKLGQAVTTPGQTALPQPASTGQENTAIPQQQPVQIQQNLPPQQQATQQQNLGIYHQHTPQEIAAERDRAARIGGLSVGAEREAQLERENARAQLKRDQLEKALTAQGIDATRLPEIYDFIKSNPNEEPQQLVGRFKREFDRIQKFDIPGFFTGLFKGGQPRQDALKRLEPVYQSYKRMGREQEFRTDLAERGLSETEISYLAKPLSQSTEKALKELPDGIFKSDKTKVGKAFAETFGGTGEGKRKSYEEELQKHPQIVAKQEEKLAEFFKNHVPMDASLLVLRDQLWNKGYDWQQIANAFDAAYPNPEQQLNSAQQAELIELHQAPIPSLSDVFGAGFGRRLAGIITGKR